MATAAHSQQQLAFTRESDSARDVSGVGATCDECGVLVDHSVPDAPRGVIAFLAPGEAAGLAGWRENPEQRRARCVVSAPESFTARRSAGSGCADLPLRVNQPANRQ